MVLTLSPFDLEKEKALLKIKRADQADTPLTDDEEFELEKALDRARFLDRGRGRLNLRWHVLRDRGIISLVHILKARGVSHYIVEFELGGCEIGDRGISILCDWLRDDKTVERLGLSCNAYGDVGMVELASLVKLNRALTALDLSGNRCTGGNSLNLPPRTHDHTFTRTYTQLSPQFLLCIYFLAVVHYFHENDVQKKSMMTRQQQLIRIQKTRA